MSYQLLLFFLLFCLYINVVLCELADSRHRWDSHASSSSTVATNRTHWNRSWNGSSTVTQNITTIKDKVEIKVYYETLCPASIRFFIRQLRPVVQQLSPHLDIQMIPYGHAETYKFLGFYIFRCQHGPLECYGNKIHACAIDTLQNNTQAVIFNACLMQYSAYRSNSDLDYSSILNLCGNELNIQGIRDCVNGERGSRLLKKHGEDTHTLRPRYVPYLVLDNSTDRQEDARRNLMATICQMLQPAPPSCHT